MEKSEILEELTPFEKEKICQLLECSTKELDLLYNSARGVFDQTDTIYDTFLKILQQGNNIREATLIGILCGRLIGFLEAEDKIELEIKEKLFNAFKNSRPF
tara:strand:- start:69 stop:374 length:306 start_codon:yes stop_codon:yes gene_type:complete